MIKSSQYLRYQCRMRKNRGSTTDMGMLTGFYHKSLGRLERRAAGGQFEKYLFWEEGE